MIIPNLNTCLEIFAPDRQHCLLCVKGWTLSDYPESWTKSLPQKMPIIEGLRYAEMIQKNQNPQSVHVIHDFMSHSVQERQKCIEWFQNHFHSSLRCLLTIESNREHLPKELRPFFTEAQMRSQKTSENPADPLRELVMKQFRNPEKNHSSESTMLFIQKMTVAMLQEIHDEIEQDPDLLLIQKNTLNALRELYEHSVTHPLMIRECQWICFEYLKKKKSILQKQNQQTSSHSPK